MTIATSLQFEIKIAGLSPAEIAAGAVPAWGMGCVVNFTAPPKQGYICRNVPLVPAAAPGPAGTGTGTDATLTDWVGATDTMIYRIGCPLPVADATNYVADPSFEGGTSTHPMPGPPGIPGCVGARAAVNTARGPPWHPC